MSGVLEFSKVYANPLSNNACLRTSFALFLLQAADPQVQAKFSTDQRSVINSFLTNLPSVQTLLRSSSNALNSTAIARLDLAQYLQEANTKLQEMINAELLCGLGQPSTRDSYKSALETAAQDVGLDLGLMNDNQALVASFNRENSCEAHVAALARVFHTTISVHKSVRDGSVYESNSTDFLSGAAGVPCQLIGGIVHFDVALPSDGETVKQLQARSDQSQTLAQVSSISFEQAAPRVAPATAPTSVPVIPVPEPIPAAISSAIRGGGHHPASSSATVSRTAQARNLLAAGMGVVTGAVTGTVSALWNRVPAIRGRSPAPARAPVSGPSRSRSAPARSVSRPTPASDPVVMVEGKISPSSSHYLLKEMESVLQKSSTGKVDTSALESSIPSFDLSTVEADLKSLSTGPATILKDQKRKEINAKISEFDDYVAAVYQLVLSEKANECLSDQAEKALFDKVVNSVSKGKIKELLSGESLDKAALVFAKASGPQTFVKLDSSVGKTG